MIQRKISKHIWYQLSNLAFRKPQLDTGEKIKAILLLQIPTYVFPICYPFIVTDFYYVLRSNWSKKYKALGIGGQNDKLDSYIVQQT